MRRVATVETGAVALCKACPVNREALGPSGCERSLRRAGPPASGVEAKFVNR